MNNVVLCGRIANDFDVRYTTGENSTAICRFSVAVKRRFKDQDGTYHADFPNCTAFGNNAEFIKKYFHKGDGIDLTGHIQTGSYTNKDGVKVYTTDVIVDSVEFPVSGPSANGNTGDNVQAGNGFMNVPDTDQEELPWN